MLIKNLVRKRNKAYEALADPETRARYDQFGEAGLGGGSWNA